MRKRVFFLGSGFSKALDNYPTLSELSDNISEKLSSKDTTINHYFYDVLSPLKNNFEHLLTYLASDLPWKNEEQKYSDRALSSKIIDIVSSVFLERACSTIEKRNEIYLEYKNLFDFFTKNSENVDFITLNYDLLLEIILQHSYYNQSEVSSVLYLITSAKMYYFPMTLADLRYMLTGMTIGDDNNRTSPRIIKLHGSINWFWTGTSPSETIYYKNLKEDDSELDIEAGLVPYIIPPVMDKNAFYNHVMIRSLWKKARELLHDADEIYLIGFSFPQTDISVRFLFQSALEGKKPIIFVINKVNDDSKKLLIDNYSQIFANRDVNYDFCKNHDVIKDLDIFLGENNVEWHKNQRN
jgi:hypothetical protein